jgi:NAD(P)-dependent dehydrogenase (short-subunit alcohol dehydrogenase family)
VVKDKVCVITGAGSGIGRATAIQLAEAGASVVAIDMDEVGLKGLAEQVQLHTCYAVDVAEAQHVDAVIRECAGSAGRIDSCLTFAAVVDDWGSPGELSQELWDRVLAVNLRGTTNVCASALPFMPAGSTVVTCASIAGALKPSPSRAPYTAAKAAVVSHTRDLAMAYGPRGVRVNTIIPGFVDTPMSRSLVAGHEDRAEAECQRIPLRRRGEAYEVAEVAGFLAGERSSYLTGAALVVDGGLSLV